MPVSFATAPAASPMANLSPDLVPLSPPEPAPDPQKGGTETAAANSSIQNDEMEFDFTLEEGALIDTSPNPTTTEFVDLLPEDARVLARTPYRGEFGEAPDFLHDDMASFKIAAAKIWCATDTLSPEQVHHAKTVGPSFLEWGKIMYSLIIQINLVETIMTQADITKFQVIMSRLSYTPPQILFKVNKSGISPTQTAMMWKAANILLGSWYMEERKAKAQRDRLKKRKKTSHKQMSMLDFTTKATEDTLVSAPPGLSAASNTSVSGTSSTPTPSTPQQSAMKQPPKKTKEILGGDVHEVRVGFKFRIPVIEKESADITARRMIADLLETLQKSDPKVAILPWTFADQAKEPVIVRAAMITKMQLTTFRTYTDRFRPSSNEKTPDVWFKMAFATTMNVEQFTHSDSSNHSAWFDTHKCIGFPATVQNADTTKVLGEFMYSGAFIDTNHLEEVIHQAARECLGKDYKKLRFGCRVRKNRDVPLPDSGTPGNWTMAENQLVSIEVAIDDERPLKNVLYKCFNKTTDPKDRPGGYNFRFLPDKAASTNGSISPSIRHNSLRKHSSVIKSLQLIKSEDIKSLDTSVNLNGQTYTLREIIQNLTYPLVHDEDQMEHSKLRPLFHTVDMAASGKDAGKVVYFTTYHDTADLAERMVAILPAYVDSLIDHDAAKKWFHADSLKLLKDVEFQYDESGNWLGTWQTPEEELMLEILDEDMHITFQLEGLSTVDQAIVNLTADDASVNTFGDALRAPSQQTGSGSLAGPAAAADTGRSGAAE
jgi:hypothetical protein